METYAQRTMRLLGDPFENYGFAVWQTLDSDARYHRVSIHELDWSSGDTVDVVIDRVEIWDRNYAKIPNKYLEPAGEKKQYIIVIHAFRSTHQSIPSAQARLYGPPDRTRGATRGCHWDCVSSNYAFRIQQYEINSGPHIGKFNYRLEKAFETEASSLNIGVPYFMWFDWAHFGQHTGANTTSGIPPAQARWHDYNEWRDFRKSAGIPPDGVGNGGANNSVPLHLQVINQNMGTAPNFWNNAGHPIMEPTVRGIRKGTGPWNGFDNNTFSIDYTTADYCNGSGSLGLIAIMQQFSSTLGMSPALICPPNLGSAPPLNPVIPTIPPAGGWSDIIKQLMKKPSKPLYDDNSSNEPSDGDHGSSEMLGLDDEIIILDADNWLEAVSDVFAFGEPGSAQERFTQILADSEAFVLEQFTDKPSLLINANRSTFFTVDGTPYFPSVNIVEGLYRLTIKREGQPTLFIVFEVREQFAVQILLKDFFNALLFPNPHSGNDVNAHISTTASLAVNYNLFDGMGNRIYARNFNLRKNHQGNHSLNSGLELPTGLLIHRFTFEDGSYKTYTTINQ